jgi:hypothetical protein
LSVFAGQRVFDRVAPIRGGAHIRDWMQQGPLRNNPITGDFRLKATLWPPFWQIELVSVGLLYTFCSFILLPLDESIQPKLLIIN